MGSAYPDKNWVLLLRITAFHLTYDFASKLTASLLDTSRFREMTVSQTLGTYDREIPARRQRVLVAAGRSA